MTDRHAAYIVTLAEDIREDDAEAVLAALRMIRGVLSVEPVVSTFEVHIAEARARAEMGTKVMSAVQSVLAKER